MPSEPPVWTPVDQPPAPESQEGDLLALVETASGQTLAERLNDLLNQHPKTEAAQKHRAEQLFLAGRDLQRVYSHTQRWVGKLAEAVEGLWLWKHTHESLEQYIRDMGFDPAVWRQARTLQQKIVPLMINVGLDPEKLYEEPLSPVKIEALKDLERGTRGENLQDPAVREKWAEQVWGTIEAEDRALMDERDASRHKAPSVPYYIQTQIVTRNKQVKVACSFELDAEQLQAWIERRARDQWISNGETTLPSDLLDQVLAITHARPVTRVAKVPAINDFLDEE